MAKNEKNIYFCNNCGFESAKWEGRCPACGEWNTFVEERILPSSKSARRPLKSNPPLPLNKISPTDTKRILTGMEELDRVLGGGIVPGGLVLIGGDPGIGKSTLLLQLCMIIEPDDKSILYVSGEESPGQIKIRAQRMGDFGKEVLIQAETDLDTIISTIQKEEPKIAIIDSIQTVYSADISSPPGSVSQVRAATNAFLELSKSKNIPIFVVGHVTKEGMVAGPRMLEHMVDTVLYFEGEKNANYRILRSVKNRFGSTNEIGVFEMSGSGLRQVKNPSEYMLYGRPLDASGSVVTATLEGSRPILLELQALVCKSNFGMPRRNATGCDYNRINLLMAVLEKRLSLPLSEYDAFINIAGGMKVNEPAIDLGIVIAVLSSFKDVCIDSHLIAFGEVGLNGEVRSITQPLARIKEAAKLGFKKCILPQGNITEDMKKNDIELIGVSNIKDVRSYIF